MAENIDLGYIEMLQEAIRKAHGCGSSHIKSEPIKELFQGKTVWEGVVETFSLINHPRAKVCYAWAHATRDVGQEVRVVTVLGLSPIESPLKAVQASILNDIKSRK
jgi:hypothetical protein